MFTKEFSIAMPNEPLKNDFSDNTTITGTYKGPRYIKIEYNNESKIVGNWIDEGDTEAEFAGNPVAEGCTSTTLDADVDTKWVAYITGFYTTGDVADYEEDLGTTDGNGDAEKFTFYWHDGTGVLAQIYNQGTIKFEDGAIPEPTVRVHTVTEADFTESVNSHIANATTEAARDVYSDDEKTAINAYKSTLEGLSTKYSGKDHWKIPFPQQPDYK